MSALTPFDWRNLLDAVGRLGEARTRSELAELALPTFESLIPSDLRIIVRAEVGKGLTDYHSNQANPFTSEEIRYFETHPDHHPLVAHVKKTGDNSVRTITDVLSFSKWMENPLYRNCRHRLRLRYSLAFSLSNDPGTVFGVTLDRVGRDFSGREAEMLELLRPHFARTWQRLETREKLAAEANGSVMASTGGEALRRYVRLRELGLSQRESDVLGLLANGATYKQISLDLDIGVDTVRTYIRRIYQKLGSQSRTQAAAKYFQY